MRASLPVNVKYMNPALAQHLGDLGARATAPIGT